MTRAIAAVVSWVVGDEDVSNQSLGGRTKWMNFEIGILEISVWAPNESPTSMCPAPVFERQKRNVNPTLRNNMWLVPWRLCRDVNATFYVTCGHLLSARNTVHSRYRLSLLGVLLETCSVNGDNHTMFVWNGSPPLQDNFKSPIGASELWFWGEMAGLFYIYLGQFTNTPHAPVDSLSRGSIVLEYPVFCK